MKHNQGSDRNAEGIVAYKGLFTERDYGYANGALIRDRMAGVNYRLVVDPGFGRYFRKRAILLI